MFSGFQKRIKVLIFPNNPHTMKKTLIIFSLFFSFSALAQDGYFMSSPAPTPDGNRVVFSFDSDLWIVNSSGGNANRLTAMDGEESFPRISPDGKWVAFTSTQMGNSDIYVMSIDGGEIKQLTFNSSNDRTETWSWDSKTIYFRSNRYNRVAAYSISAKGGTPQRLVSHYFNQAHNLAIHPDGRLFFNESWESSNQVARKRYRGAYNPDIKTYNPKNGAYEKLTSWEGKDMWSSIDKAGKVYFSSDENNGQYNLYTFENGLKAALTEFKTSIKDPQVSANGSVVVFEKDYQLYAFDPTTKKSRKIDISITNHSVLAASKEYNTKGAVSNFDVAPDGKKMAFVSRGRLFVSDISGKFIKELSTNEGERVIEVKWLKDSEHLIFNQTVNGYANLFTINAKSNNAVKQLTDDEMFNRNIELNAAMTHAAYLSGRNQVRLINLASFNSETIANEELWGLYNPQPRFSPDGKYLTFTVKKDFEEDVFVYEIDSKTLTNLTKTGVPETSPFWGPNGKYLYFTTNRTEPSYPFGMQNGDIYRIPLKKHEADFKSTELAKVFVEKEDEEKEESQATSIDFNLKVMKQMESIGVSFGSQSNPFVIQKKDKTHVLYVSNHDEGRPALWMTTLTPYERPKTEKIGNNGFVGNLIIVKDQLYALSRGSINKVNLGAKKMSSIDTEFKFNKSLRKEFDQMYFETWAGVEGNFYNETFHNEDWPALKKQYATYLPYVKSRAELRVLLNDLLGELNSSHMGFRSGGPEEGTEINNSSLNLGIEFDNNRPYQVARIISNGPMDYPGKGLVSGDELVAINGLEIDPKINREFYLSKTSISEEITLTFNKGKSQKVIKLHPASMGAMRTALYDEWVDHNQEVVDQKGDGKVAYVHMKNMSGGELENFLIEMTSEGYNRDGLILDLRYNTGGNVHDRVLNFLSQKPYLQWKYREGQLTSQSNFGAGAKPTVLLINEQSLSDAEMTAAGFKELGLGKVIGTETYRWIIFTSGASLVDGSFYRLPSWGCYTLDGQNLEKTGVVPDIKVANSFSDRVNGRDPQLDRAIQEVLNQLKN